MSMMMMNWQPEHGHPTVEVPAASTYDDPTTPVFSPQTNDYFCSLRRYLPSSASDVDCDNFRMYEFKVRKCARGRSHDWTECPYAHPGEKARRRDPRKYNYSGTACPEFRRGNCRKGDCCELSHGVFECWLHPARYRTQPCKDGSHCNRRVCFFAHSPEQLRVSELMRMRRELQFTIEPCKFNVWSPRVESGKDVRATMYAKLSMENSDSLAPDFGWVSDLVN